MNSETSLKQNLIEERPQWKLSVYGPAKEEPNLIVGVDRSVEEDRLLYYTSMRTTGNNSQYVCWTISKFCKIILTITTRLLVMNNSLIKSKVKLMQLSTIPQVQSNITRKRNQTILAHLVVLQMMHLLHHLQIQEEHLDQVQVIVHLKVEQLLVLLVVEEEHQYLDNLQHLAQQQQNLLHLAVDQHLVQLVLWVVLVALLLALQVH